MGAHIRPIPYSARAAWRRAAVYFVACWLIGWGSGAVQLLLGAPLVTPENVATPAWWLFTAVSLAVILVGYGVVWPRGTLTHGRALVLPAVLLFGMLWGISEGLLFLSIWLTVSRLVDANWLIILVAFAIISTFVGVWHAQYWDIYVAPEHNIDSWNLRKVLFAHIPNLLVTLTYLTLFGNGGLFVGLQTIALLLSTYFMHFPPFWATNHPHAD